MNLNSLLKRSLATALLAGLVLAATVVSAQPDPKPSSPKKSPYSLEIDGGFLKQPTGDEIEATLENVVELLRELEFARNGDPANIVLSPDLPKIKIANLKLAATTLTQELEALRVASGERFTWSTGESPGAMVDPNTGHLISPPSDQLPLYILRPEPESGRSRLRVEAFSLAGYFESRKKSNDEAEYTKIVDQEISQLYRIVEETVAMYADMDQQLNRGEAASARSPSLRFHSGANLLIVTGEINGVEIAAKVISALPHVQRSGGNVAGGYGGEMGVQGMPGPAADAFRRRYGIAPQPGVGAPGAPPTAR